MEPGTCAGVGTASVLDLLLARVWEGAPSLGWSTRDLSLEWWETGALRFVLVGGGPGESETGNGRSCCPAGQRELPSAHVGSPVPHLTAVTLDLSRTHVQASLLPVLLFPSRSFFAIFIPVCHPAPAISYFLPYLPSSSAPLKCSV